MTTRNEIGLEIHPQVGENFGRKRLSGEPRGEGIKALHEREAEFNICLARKAEVNCQLFLPLPRLLPWSSRVVAMATGWGGPVENDGRSQLLSTVPTAGCSWAGPGWGKREDLR